MSLHPMLRIPDRHGRKPTLRGEVNHLPGGGRVYDAPMPHDPIAQRIEAFDQANGGGVGFYKEKGAYHLYLLETEAPIARLKPTGVGDEVRLGYWSHRRRWEDVDDMGGVVKPLDEDLQFIATTDIFWLWT
jgi:hypothetical protein